MTYNEHFAIHTESDYTIHVNTLTYGKKLVPRNLLTVLIKQSVHSKNKNKTKITSKTTSPYKLTLTLALTLALTLTYNKK